MATAKNKPIIMVAGVSAFHSTCIGVPYDIDGDDEPNAYLFLKPHSEWTSMFRTLILKKQNHMEGAQSEEDDDGSTESSEDIMDDESDDHSNDESGVDSGSNSEEEFPCDSEGNHF